MATTGVMGPWMARYTNVNGVISYSEGMKVAATTDFDAEIDTTDNNDFFADNGLKETERRFTNGTLSNSVDNFDQAGSRLVLGTTLDTIEIDGESYNIARYNNEAQTPYLGYGIIITERLDGKNLYRAVVFKKVMFSIPSDAATTQTDSITWQTRSLSATILRDDSPKEEWKVETTVSTVEKATKFIRYVLNIAEIGYLNVLSEPGDRVGSTMITVTPYLIEGNSYKYIVAADVGLPEYDSVIGNAYQDWDGESDITAVTGLKIMIVEVDEDSRAKKAGIAVIQSNDG